jgi:polar amino acid transport system substrate-binding protein
MRQRIASLKIKGCAAVFALTLLASGVVQGQALAQTAPAELPRPFDARERIARPDLSQVVRLRIVTTVDFPPFNFADQTGRLSGFNLDLAREICRELQLESKCQIQALPFEDLEKTLESGGAEAAMAGITVTPELRRRFLFSRPYLSIPARFARNSKAVLKGETAAALAGHPVGVVAGTVHEAMLKAFFPAIDARPFDAYEAMLEALKKGEVEAVFADGLRLSFWTAGEASGNCCALFDGPYLSQKYLGEGLSVMIRRNDPDLVTAFDHALLELSRNGRLQDIYLRYFPNGLY